MGSNNNTISQSVKEKQEEERKKFYAVKHKSVHPSILKDMLLQLEAEGLIVVEPDKRDRRRMVVRKP
jgi:hypothetical protein